MSNQHGISFTSQHVPLACLRAILVPVEEMEIRAHWDLRDCRERGYIPTNCAKYSTIECELCHYRERKETRDQLESLDTRESKESLDNQ